MASDLGSGLSKRRGERHVDERVPVDHTEPQQSRHRPRLQKPRRRSSRHQYQKELENAEGNNVARRPLIRDVQLRFLLVCLLLVLLPLQRDVQLRIQLRIRLLV